MAQVRVTQKSNTKWVALLALLAAAGGVAWWKLGGNDPAEGGAALVADSASTVASGPSTGQVTDIADVVPGATSPAVVIAQQQAAAKEVEAQPILKPITGPVSERPSFVSPMEWTLLQATAQQHPDPDKKLVEMLNFMRYMKQSEVLEGMPKPGEPGQRRALAEALLSDLPQRVLNGDLDMKGAREELGKLIEDAEPDVKRREKRLEAEVKRLLAADAAARKSDPSRQAEQAASANKP
jgi:hypothetical protein